MHDREQQMGAAYEAIERQLTVVGTTAIRDELQPDVEATLDSLERADIKCWMITGDKGSTAKTIAKTCGLFRPADHVISIDGETVRLFLPLSFHSPLLSQCNHFRAARLTWLS